MLILNSKIVTAEIIYGELVLPYALREKSRQRARLRSGEEVALFTVRGTVLRHGDLLQGSASDGDGEEGKQDAGQPGPMRVVCVVAAEEQTYRVVCDTPGTLLRCAFHLGNRHTQVEVGHDAIGFFLRIRRDPVLREMLTGLGATVQDESAPFEPESGAYGDPGGAGSGHHHDDGSHANPWAPVPLRQKIHRPANLSPDR